MLARLSSHVTETLIQSNAIKATDKEIYQYGFKMIFIYAIDLMSILITGFVMGRLWECFFYQLIFIPLRQNAGGYHCNSELRCYFLSVGQVVAVMIALAYIPIWFGKMAILIFMLAAGVVILVLAPVENKNKPLDSDEIKVYGYRARVVLLVEVVVALACYFFSWNTVFLVIALGIFSIACSLVAGVCANYLQA